MSTAPVIYSKDSKDELDQLKGSTLGLRVVDVLEEQLAELYQTINPAAQLTTRDFKNFCENYKEDTWIYYPWSQTLLHIVGEQDLFALRTNRNQQLITTQEQEKLASTIVGIAGMSVGSSIALALTYSGISREIKIADQDVLSTTNLNRLRESLADVGKSKTSLAAQHIYEIDPYAKVHEFDQGLTKDNLNTYFSNPKLNVVVDEIDDFRLKVDLRIQAREKQIPLLMFTSLGDNILIDVERYDTQPNLPIFNGLLGDIGEEILAKEVISQADIKKYSVQLVGQEFVPTRALGSLAEMGKTLVGRPQLYSTIAVDGGIAAYIIRRILLGDAIKSGRYFIEFSKLFDLQNDELANSQQRKEYLESVLGNG